MYTIKEIISVLEEMAPLAYAEDFDNVGLLVESGSK
jgi:putative NIF3 family GTP cyclohydrolase 1 type 2